MGSGAIGERAAYTDAYADAEWHRYLFEDFFATAALSDFLCSDET